MTNLTFKDEKQFENLLEKTIKEYYTGEKTGFKSIDIDLEKEISGRGRLEINFRKNGELYLTVSDPKFGDKISHANSDLPLNDIYLFMSKENNFNYVFEGLEYSLEKEERKITFQRESSSDFVLNDMHANSVLESKIRLYGKAKERNPNLNDVRDFAKVGSRYIAKAIEYYTK